MPNVCPPVSDRLRPGSDTFEGVIFQATYRIHGGRPVVYLYGRLADGASFLVRDHGQSPHFYIHARWVEAATRLGAQCGVEPIAVDFAGEPVVTVTVAVPAEVPALRERLHAHDIATFEADVRFAYRLLIDRQIKGAVCIRGERQPGEHTHWQFEDPQLTPAAVAVAPRVLAFDIETDPVRDRLLAISVYGCDHAEVLLCDPGRRSLPPGVRGFADERGTLVAFVRLLQKLDPDVLTGWNVIDFDLAMLLKFCRRLGVTFDIGRGSGAMRLRPAVGYFGSSSVAIPGRIVLDGVDLLRGAFIKMESYSLDSVARAVLGEGKVLEGDVKDRVGEILHRYQHDLPGFAAYSLADSRLVLEIVTQLKLIDLAFERSQLTGMMPDRVAASIASFDFLYLSELHQRRVVAPTLRTTDDTARVPQAGGQVFEPVPGLYENVLVFDFKSLYPSIIRTFNIDPLGFIAEPQDRAPEELIAVAGAAFERTPGILPSMLDVLFPRRERAKADGDEVASQAIKILMNSCYGVLGTSACRFFNPHIANAITGQGRSLLGWAKDWFEAQGLSVLYGDTDSLFVHCAAPYDPGSGPALAAALNDALAADLKVRFAVTSKLELEFEKCYTQLFLPALRGGTGGARKRYVGSVAGTLQFVGMEVVRSDWTDLAKTVQRELYERLFADGDIAGYLASVVTELRAGRFDDQLVYRKALRKPLEQYTASTPPHVQAARKSPGGRARGSSHGRRRVIEYVMTTDGPEPLDHRLAPIDIEHYVHKQILPVAQPVLDTLDLVFAQVVGDDTQLGLF